MVFSIVILGNLCDPGIYSKAVWTRAKCWAVKKSTNVEAPVLMGGTLNDDGSLKGGFGEIYQPRSEGGSDGSCTVHCNLHCNFFDAEKLQRTLQFFAQKSCNVHCNFIRL